MAERQIVVYDNSLLYRKSRRIRRVSPALRELIADMFETMHAANGIGLAAIQVGVPERLIVVEIPEENTDETPADGTSADVPFVDETSTNVSEEASSRPSVRYVVINPEMARKSREVEEGIEGCLSVPGLVGEVPRHRAVTIKGLDPQGRIVRIKAEGLLARVFQHEIDHCNGTLFIDHIDDPEKIWPVTEGEEEAAEAAQEVPGRKASSGPLV